MKLILRVVIAVLILWSCFVTSVNAGIGVAMDSAFFNFLFGAVVIIIGGIIAAIVSRRITEYKLKTHDSRIDEINTNIKTLADGVDMKLYDKNNIPIFMLRDDCEKRKDEEEKKRLERKVDTDKRSKDGRRAIYTKVEGLEKEMKSLVSGQREVSDTVNGVMVRLDTYIEENAKIELAEQIKTLIAVVEAKLK